MFKVGDRVVINGNTSSSAIILHGKIGIITDVNEKYGYVRVNLELETSDFGGLHFHEVKHVDFSVFDKLGD